MPATPTAVSSLPVISATPDTVWSPDTVSPLETVSSPATVWSPAMVSSPATVSITVWPSPPNKYKTNQPVPVVLRHLRLPPKQRLCLLQAARLSCSECSIFLPPERLPGLATGPSSYVLGETRQTPHHFIWRHAIFQTSQSKNWKTNVTFSLLNCVYSSWQLCCNLL